MNNIDDDFEIRDVFNRWVEKIDFHQYQIFVETAKIVDLLKCKSVSAKTI